jgi:hypothetical protein
MTAPLLSYASTGIKTGQMYKEAMYEQYAADAGVEEALQRISSGDVTLHDLDMAGAYSYALPSDVNSLPVSVTVTKLDLLQGVISPDEYNPDQPHEGWINFGAPLVVNQTADYVEYSCTISLHYGGTGSRRIQVLGAMFYRYVGGESLVEGPNDVVPTQVITFDDLQADSPETLLPPNGLAFVWRWEQNKGPRFDQHNRDGELSFTFRVYDPEWEADTHVAFATIKEEDVSYITSLPDSYKWLIEATGGDTLLEVGAINEIGEVIVLTWEVDPQ